MSQPRLVPRKMKLFPFPVRSTWLANQEYPGENHEEALNSFAFAYVQFFMNVFIIKVFHLTPLASMSRIHRWPCQ